ncbi:MAG: bifunctional UDP-4-keto-pentose/UDP-xylose synthase [Chitinivibrionales bacterium]|nr:bifunctional UDP-4-keto-pentose/UDP-xylose synthase [Chitinivibrionales bacterium]
MTQKQTIGIIGCAGFIGSHLVERLLAQPQYLIKGIDQSSEKIGHLLGHPNFQFECTDAYIYERRDEWLASCDVVILLAALCNPSLYNTIPLRVIESNFTKPMHLVDRCGVLGKRLIYFSTCEVYGKTVAGVCAEKGLICDNPEKEIFSEDASPLVYGSIDRQRWSYAAAKQLMERYIYANGFERNLEYTIIRPFNFIGPRMDFIDGVDGEGIPRVLACFMKNLLKNEPLLLVDNGTQRRAFTAIADACDAVMRVIERPVQSKQQIFNIGNPENEVSIADLAGMMIGLYNECNPEKHHSAGVQIVTNQRFYGSGYDDCDRRIPDITKARTLLGWEPKTTLVDSLRQTIEYYCDHYARQIQTPM